MSPRSRALLPRPQAGGADALKPFSKRLRPSGARIEAVAMDMSAAYRGAVSAHLKEAVIVYDHFHVIKLFQDKPADLRRSLYHRAEADRKKVLEGARWLLLKNPENLDTDKDEKQRLEEAPGLNKPLAVAYDLKEDLRRFWERPGKRFATAFLNDWLRKAEASGVRVRQQMAKTLAAHRSGLLASYDAMITSGPMEGTNGEAGAGCVPWRAKPGGAGGLGGADRGGAGGDRVSSGGGSTRSRGAAGGQAAARGAPADAGAEAARPKAFDASRMRFPSAPFDYR